MPPRLNQNGKIAAKIVPPSSPHHNENGKNGSKLLPPIIDENKRNPQGEQEVIEEIPRHDVQEEIEEIPRHDDHVIVKILEFSITRTFKCKSTAANSLTYGAPY